VDKCTPEEIKERIRQIAFNAMVKSEPAIYDSLDPADRAYKGLKKKKVRPAHVSFLLKNGDLSRLHVCILHFAAISIHVQKEPV
jgi:hypothetical protein